MSKFIIYHAISPNGYEVEIMTDSKPGGITYKELAQEETRIMKMEAAGWKVKKAVDVQPAPQKPPTATTAPQAPLEGPCPTCGGPTTFREGVSKAGKPYKGYFCDVKDGREHTPQWVK